MFVETPAPASYTQASAFAALFVEDENIAFQKKADNRHPVILRYPFEQPIDLQFMVINPFKENAPSRAQEYVAHRNGVIVEMDTISLQLQRNWFSQVIGKPTVAVFSGNKSVHNMLSFTTAIPTEQDDLLIQMLKKIFPFADFQVLQDCARLCRTPGAVRDNGKLQIIESINEKWDVDKLFEITNAKTSHITKIPYVANSSVKKLHSGKIKINKVTREINEDDRAILWHDILQDMVICGYALTHDSFEYIALQEQAPYMPKDFDLDAAIQKARDEDKEACAKKEAKKVFVTTSTSNGDVATWVKEQLAQMSEQDLLQILKRYYNVERVNERGKNITCCCAFHDEKNPSSYIAIHEDGIPKYYCSACNFAGKDAINLIKEARPDLTFTDICQELFGRKPPKYCYHCKQEIIFNNNIPCDMDGNPHQCTQKIDVCRKCTKEIRWKDKKPYNLDGTPHTHRRQAAATKQSTSTSTATITTQPETWTNEKGKILPGIAAEAFIASTKGNLIYVKENFYEFVGGVWKIIDDRVVANRIRNLIGIGAAKQTTIHDILYQVTIILLERFSSVVLNEHKMKLCFLNCILDLDTFKLEEHNREYYHTIQLPYEYKPLRIDNDADLEEDMEKYAPNWHHFLKSIGFSNAAIKRLQEWCGYLLVPTTKLERCLFLKGEGSNGKSTLLEVIIGVLGSAQVSSLEPQELFERFKVCMIQDKLANICSDIETSQVFDARFKKLVSGEDQIGEEKKKRPYKFRPHARFIFSANDFIPTRDRSHAFFRRFDVMDFKIIFEEKDQDKDLKDKLRAEIPYIINWFLRGLISLRQNNWQFTESSEFAEAKQEFELSANPIKQFVDEEIKITKNTNDKLKCSALRERYVNWCKMKGCEVMADNKLGRELKRLGIAKKRLRDEIDRAYVYLGILLQ